MDILARLVREGRFHFNDRHMKWLRRNSAYALRHICPIDLMPPELAPMPQDAKWLADTEKATVRDVLAQEDPIQHGGHELRDALLAVNGMSTQKYPMIPT